MTSTLTLNQIEAIFKSFSDRHKQIKSFYFGELYDLDASNVSFSYPFLGVIPGTIELGSNGESFNLINYSFTVIVGGWVNSDNSNENEVRSDAALILGDLANEFNREFYYENDIEVTNTMTMTPFNERFTDVVTGYSMNLTITTPFRNTYCDSPIEDKDLIKIICDPNG